MFSVEGRSSSSPPSLILETRFVFAMPRMHKVFVETVVDLFSVGDDLIARQFGVVDDRARECVDQQERLLIWFDDLQHLVEVAGNVVTAPQLWRFQHERFLAIRRAQNVPLLIGEWLGDAEVDSIKEIIGFGRRLRGRLRQVGYSARTLTLWISINFVRDPVVTIDGVLSFQHSA